MARVFLSYAHEDRDHADELHRIVVAAGHQVFLAHDLYDGTAAGEQWRDRLFERLRWADASSACCPVPSLNPPGVRPRWPSPSRVESASSRCCSTQRFGILC